MTKKSLSRLGLLMDRFNITGRELANALHVDYTLVSKWRNHTRILTPRSTHLKKIIEYFVAFDSNTHYSKLIKILSEAYPEIQIGTEKDIALFLSRWLSDNDDDKGSNALPISMINSRNVSSGQFYIFKDNAGRREASIKFLQIALSSEVKGQELLLFSQENPSWFYDDPEFVDVWREKNLDFLNKGGNIQVIHTIDRLYKSIANSLIKWLPLHMTGKTLSYYYPQILDTPIKTTLYVLKNHAVIFGITAEGLSKTSYTYLTAEPITIQQCEFVLQSLLGDSLPLFEKFFSHQTDKLMKTIVKAGLKDENNYYITLPPTLGMMSQEMLRSILIENNLEDEVIKTYISYQATLKEQFYAHSGNYHFRCIYDINKLEEILASDEIILSELSIFTGKRIKVSRNTLCQCIEEMTNVLKEVPHFEIALIEGPPAPGLENLNIWIKENVITVSSSIDSYANLPFALATQETTAVNSCFHFINQVWKAIPQVKRDKNWIRQKLFHTILKAGK